MLREDYFPELLMCNVSLARSQSCGNCCCTLPVVLSGISVPPLAANCTKFACFASENLHEIQYSSVFEEKDF